MASRSLSQSTMSTILRCSAVAVVLLASMLFTTLSAQDVCASLDQPNPIAAQYPDVVSGNLNGTTMIVPIALALAQSLVPQYSILEASYRSLLPSFPEGAYPLMVSTKHDHDLQVPAYNLTSPDFSRAAFEFPFVDLSGDGVTPYRLQNNILLTASNKAAIQGARGYGINVYPADFDPPCDAYRSDGLGGTYFSATGVRNAGDTIDRFVTVSTRPISSYQKANPYPFEFIQSITNQVTFGNSSLCDHYQQLYNTSLTAAPYEPVAVVGTVSALLEPFNTSQTWTEAVASTFPGRQSRNSNAELPEARSRYAKQSPIDGFAAGQKGPYWLPEMSSDEGKPRCQRCIAGGFECQYGTRLSFLEKNAFTAEGPSVQTKEAAPNPTYRKVQFVDEVSRASSHDQQQEKHPQVLQPRIRELSSPGQAKNNSADPTGEVWGSPAHTATVQSDEVVRAREFEQSSTPDTSWSPGILVSPGPSGGDQIALDALLSLGNEHATVFIDANLHRNSASSPVFRRPHTPLVYHDALTSNEGRVVHDIPLVSSLSVGSGHKIPNELEFTLLKHYRYHVAPWLDLCDLGQTFGMAVTCLAIESDILFRNLLTLAACSMRETSSGEVALAIDNATLLGSSESHSSGAKEKLVCISLSRVRKMFDPQDGFSQDGVLDATVSAAYDLLLESPELVSLSAYHLIVRLEFGKALMQELPLSIPSDMPQMLHSQWHQTEQAMHVFSCAHATLFLCIRAMNFCWGEPADRMGQSGDMVSTWRALVEELNSWFSRRPQEFLSMVEIEIADDGYPMILFTSGAAVFGNQLYHTAMFLLLRHKPRTVVLPSRHRSSTMSSLWHARRICGIALNNQRRECWDMSLVASLLVAARTMTHEAQHEALLAGINKVEKLTGWSLETSRDILKADWGM
ncbi:hypothetical protein SUNI508_12734 [Seiridium unicorne]|uniref:Uncharacterized protein n=1 Tax=Seiridium unicorne TaxID=138068 RepID=A0ABR2VG91_9PEZI